MVYQCQATPVTPEGHQRSPPKGGKLFEEALDHLAVMMDQEQLAYQPCLAYLSAELQKDVNDKSGEVTEGWRRKLVEWAYSVVDHFGFDREAVAIAMDFLDRSVAATALSSGVAIGKRRYQLMAVSSLYMALKIHGENEDDEDGLTTPRRKLRIDAFVELSRGFFLVEVIEATESMILETLNWRVHPPTCLSFIANFLRLCPADSPIQDPQVHAQTLGSIYDVARYLAELSICVSSFAFEHKNSLAAYSSVLLGMEVLQRTQFIPRYLQDAIVGNMSSISGYQPNDPQVLCVCQELRNLCPNMFPRTIKMGSNVLASSSNNNSCEKQTQSPSGKSSPVCVMDDLGESGRKRSRSR